MGKITGGERDALLLEVLKRLKDAKPHADAAAWERGWQEALARFRANPTEDALIPAFIRDEPVRLGNSFFKSNNTELGYVRHVQAELLDLLQNCENIHEFGCGTGFNTVALANRAPGKAYVACDRSWAAVQIVLEASERFQLPILAGQFDMLKPHGSMPYGAGVFTFGSMEQLGEFRPFINWLIGFKPAMVVHIEPIPELLDPNNLLDWLSLEFHRKRGYTVGLLPYLQAHPGVEVLQAQRSHFGSLMLESYARVVWRTK